MSRILITGGLRGIGRPVAELLASQGHQVTVQGHKASKGLPDTIRFVKCDLSDRTSIFRASEELNKQGAWDAVIHTAGGGPVTSNVNMPLSAASYSERRIGNGFDEIFQLNTLARYQLTCLMNRPRRILYLTRPQQSEGDDSFRDLAWLERRQEQYSAVQSAKDSQLHSVLLARAVTQAWPTVQACSFNMAPKPGHRRGPKPPGDAPSEPVRQVASFAAGENVIVGEESGVYFDETGILQSHEAAQDSSKISSFMAGCAQYLDGLSLSK